MKTLIWKELRENIRWLPIGLIVIAAVAWMSRPSRSGGNSLVASVLVTQLAIVTPLLAFSLGVVQSYRDLQAGAGAYLNHRGVTRSDVFFAKIISGFLLHAVSVILPLLGLAGWIAYQGMSWYPMRPAQVLPGMVFALGAWVMHPAAMLMMVRDASWWGTRLLPLVPAGGALTLLFIPLPSGGWQAAFWSALVAVLPIVWMIFVARQGWTRLAGDPAAASMNPRLEQRWLLPTYLLVGTIVGYITAVAVSFAIISDLQNSKSYVPQPNLSLKVDEDSEQLWLVTALSRFSQREGTNVDEVLGGDSVQSDTPVDAMAEGASQHRFRDFSYLSPLHSNRRSDGFFTSIEQSQTRPLGYAYDSRGYLLGYQLFPTRRWVQTIAADGAYPAGDWSGAPFVADPLSSGMGIFSELTIQGYPSPLITRRGVYVLDQDPTELRKLISLEIDAAALLSRSPGETPRLVLRSGDRLAEYRLIDASGSEDWYSAGESESGALSASRKPPPDIRLDAQQVREFTLPTTMDGRTTNLLRVGWTSDGLFVATYDYRWKSIEVYRISATGPTEQVNLSIAPESLPVQYRNADRFEPSVTWLGLLPGGVYLAGFAMLEYLYWSDGSVPNEPFVELVSRPVTTMTVLIPFLFVSVLAFWLVRRAAYRRGLSHRQRRWWLCSVPIFGLAAPLAMLTIYRFVVREPCSACKASRRIDRFECEHCRADWQPLTETDIEVRDKPASENVPPD